MFYFFCFHRKKIPLRMRMMIMTKRRRETRRRKKKTTSQMKMINLKRVESPLTPLHLFLRQKSLKIRKEVRSKSFIIDVLNTLWPTAFTMLRPQRVASIGSLFFSLQQQHNPVHPLNYHGYLEQLPDNNRWQATLLLDVVWFNNCPKLLLLFPLYEDNLTECRNYILYHHYYLSIILI